MAKKKKAEPTPPSQSEVMRKLINKKTGRKIAHNLNEEDPTLVKDWISTGSRWLDSITCRGRLGGIPVGRVTEIAGLESTGKSFLGAQIATNAQKMGITVVYFDSESAIDSAFLEKAGVNIKDLVYVQPVDLEQVLEIMELCFGDGNRYLFILDSLAFCPSRAESNSDFNPQSTMAAKARVLAGGVQKILISLADNDCTWLVLNQLKTNINAGFGAAFTEPYVTPGGKALNYAYSLRIWLTGRKAKASFVLDDKGFQIGSEVKVKLQKSRFGTLNRICNFKILWGTKVGVEDEESWLDAIKSSPKLSTSGSWYTLVGEGGEEYKFQAANWTRELQKPKFRELVLSIIDEEVIRKFDDRQGEASQFYDEA